jgi:hypothetical protein
MLITNIDKNAAKNMIPMLIHVAVSNGNTIFSNDVYRSPGGTYRFGLKVLH